MYSRKTSADVTNRSNGTNHRSHSNGITPVEKNGYVEMDYKHGEKRKSKEGLEMDTDKKVEYKSIGRRDVAEIVSKLAVCLLCGMVMGLSLEKGRGK